MDEPVLVKADTVLKLGQRMEISVPGNTRTYASMLDDIRESSIVLAMPVDAKNNPLIAAPGTSVTCKAFDGHCYYKFVSSFQSKGDENGPVWFVDRPVDVEKYQYRVYVRVKTSQPLVVRAVNMDGSREPMIFTKTIDMSGGGLCFPLDSPLMVNSKVSVELDNIPGVGLIQLMCRVARCVEAKADGKTVYQIGVEFLSINRMIQNKLVKYIFDLQRDGLAKGIDDL